MVVILTFNDFCIKNELTISNRYSRKRSKRNYLKYKHFMKYIYEPCIWKLFINKLYNYEPDIVSLICYLVTGSYKWKPITDIEIPLMCDLFTIPHVSQCYATYHGSIYFINHYNLTVDNSICSRCKKQKGFELEYCEPKYWRMNDVTERFAIHTNKLSEMKQLKKYWGIGDIKIKTPLWYLDSTLHGRHIKIDFATKNPNGISYSYIDPSMDPYRIKFEPPKFTLKNLF